LWSRLCSSQAPWLFCAVSLAFWCGLPGLPGVACAPPGLQGSQLPLEPLCPACLPPPCQRLAGGDALRASLRARGCGDGAAVRESKRREIAGQGRTLELRCKGRDQDASTGNGGTGAGDHQTRPPILCCKGRATGLGEDRVVYSQVRCLLAGSYQSYALTSVKSMGEHGQGDG
jgi:hypothetical protein